jgi:hypothetical protein
MPIRPKSWPRSLMKTQEPLTPVSLLLPVQELETLYFVAL